MEMEEEKEQILKALGDSVRQVYAEWCSRGHRGFCDDNAVSHTSITGVVTGVDSALTHGLRKPSHGYWPLLSSLLDQDTRSHLLLYPCPKARGWYWVLRCLSRGELEALITVVLSHLQLLPPLYLPHALLLDPSAQLVLPTLLAGLEHVTFAKVIEEELKYPHEVTNTGSKRSSFSSASTPRLLKSFRSSLLSGSASRKQSSNDINSSGDGANSSLPHPNTSSSACGADGSPHFMLNISQPQFPSLQPSTSYNSTAPSGAAIPLHLQFTSLHHPVMAPIDQDLPIEACAEATEALNEQVLDAEEEAEKMVEVHHFGKQKRKGGRRSRPSSGAFSPSSTDETRRRKKKGEDEAEAQEMSLEDELRAATDGSFIENRPPFSTHVDPDLIVGIVGDDKLVKVLPDVSANMHDEDFSGAEEVDVEIIEVFSSKKERSSLEKCDNLAVENAPAEAAPRSACNDLANKHGSLKKSTSSPCKISLMKGGPSKSSAKTGTKNSAIEKSEGLDGRKSTNKHQSKEKPKSGQSNQEQLVVAKQIIKSLASQGVLEQTPELRRVLEVLEQSEAMLSERSPPEGQEDPPHTGGHGPVSVKNKAKNEKESVQADEENEEEEEEVEEECSIKEDEEDEGLTSNMEEFSEREEEEDGESEGETGLEESTALSESMDCSTEEESSESSDTVGDEEDGRAEDSDRMAGVGVASTDSESSTDSGEESSVEEEEGSQVVLDAAVPLPSYENRRLPIMEDSVYSLDEGVGVEENEALTEGCRDKSSIVGGSKWEELMAGRGNGSGGPATRTSVDCNHSEKNSSSKNATLTAEPVPVMASTPNVPAAKKSNGLAPSNSVVEGTGKVQSEKEDSFVCEDSKDTEKCFPVTGLTRTQSFSSCGSKYDARSDGKLSSALASKLECRLDSASESVVAALDDAAREAQQQLLNLHTQLQHYRKMAARKKNRKILDSKLSPAIKFKMLGLYDPVTLGPPLPLSIYPLRHEYVPVPGCEDCDAQILEDEKVLKLYYSRCPLSNSESSQNILSSAIFRRPGERLSKVFIMREGHVRGRASTVRVVLSSHALYVLNTCPAPALLHALPYTQIHTVVLGGYKDWVVIISRGVVESASSSAAAAAAANATRKDSKSSALPGPQQQNVMGIQLCVADPVVTEEFVAYLELQTRKALMASYANEMKSASEGKTPSQSQIPYSTSKEQLRMSDSCTSDQFDNWYCDSASACGDNSANNVSDTQQKKVTKVGGLSDAIEHLVPCVVEGQDWEKKVLEQWLQNLLPVEPTCTVLGSWLVEWDGGAVLEQQGALGPTMEGPLMFRTTKLFSTWRNSHFLLKAGVLYQFWCDGDRLPNTMLDVTSCSACTVTMQHNKPHAFQVIQSDGSPLLLAAPDADQAGRWIRAISAVLASAAGRPSARRPTPCRLLLLPNSLVLIHQSDLLLSSPPTYSNNSPELHHPTSQYHPSSTSTAMAVLSPSATIEATKGFSGSNSSVVPPSVGNLRASRHLSTSLSSLASNNSTSKNSSSAASQRLSQPQPTVTPSTGHPPPPRSLSLSHRFSQDWNQKRPLVAPTLYLNTRAEVVLLAKLELRHLAGIGRYNECSNTTVLEVYSSRSAWWREGEAELSPRGGAQSAPQSAGDWALYFRGAEQLEHFLTALAGQAVVCEREVSDSSLQQFLLEGAVAAAGGWAALTASSSGSTNSSSSTAAAAALAAATSDTSAELKEDNSTAVVQ